MPEKPQKGDYEQPNGPPPVPPRPQSVSFSDDQPRQMEHHELNPFSGGGGGPGSGGAGASNPFKQNGSSDGYGQETSFMGDYDSGYQRSDNYLNR